MDTHIMRQLNSRNNGNLCDEVMLSFHLVKTEKQGICVTMFELNKVL